jgi:hypothetical protein
MPTVKVAITGTLSIPRSEAVRLIEEKTNAKFSKSVSWDTSYLVAARFDSEKARRAAQLGTVVINEKEMMAFIEKGEFPDVPSLSSRRAPSNLPDITWTDVNADPSQIFILRYLDAHEELTERLVAAYFVGIGDNGREYLGAYDLEGFKTFRMDRIVSIEDASVTKVC